MKRGLLMSALMICFSAFVYAQDDSADEEIDYTVEESEDGEVLEGSETIPESTHSLASPGESSSTRAYLEGEVTLRRFDEKKWKDVVGDVDFNEKPEERKAESGGLPKLPWAGPLLRILAYVVIIGVVVALIYFVVKNVVFDLKIRKTKVEDDDPGKPMDNIESLDINAMLEKALSEGNFRLAVRLYYLGLLKKLNEMGKISWTKDKTNRDYLSELLGHNFFFDEIRKLTSSYESVWYGEHELKPESYRDLTARFETVYQKLNNGPGHEG